MKSVFRNLIGLICRGARYAPGVLAGLLLWCASGWAQDASGPLTPPPPEHDVRRMTTVAEPEAPPALPPEEIIRRFAQKEDEYLAMRGKYGYRKTLRIQEFGPDGKPSGEFTMTTEARIKPDGRLVEKVIEKPQSTLQYSQLVPEDFEALTRIPMYPLTSSQLAKYDLKYVGTEQVDEIDCYIFQVKAKNIARDRAFFDGIVWVDTKYLEVVKTYGKWMNDQGDVHTPAELPFALFETYRENVDGKYWFPNYMRSDDTLHYKTTDVPMRMVIKWTDFKPLTAAPSSSSVPVAPTPEAKPPAADSANKPQ